MLGETNGGSGQIEALGGDAIDELLGRIKRDADGGNGAGNDNGGGNGDGDGGDPMGRPIDGKILLTRSSRWPNSPARSFCRRWISRPISV